jgi:hypothetical protein
MTIDEVKLKQVAALLYTLIHVNEISKSIKESEKLGFTVKKHQKMPMT